MNERAILAMKNAGIDISMHESKTVQDIPHMDFDSVVTVCDSAKEACPYFPGGQMIHLGFDDPPSLTRGMVDEGEIMKVYERVRDEIKHTIQNLDVILERDQKD